MLASVTSQSSHVAKAIPSEHDVFLLQSTKHACPKYSNDKNEKHLLSSFFDGVPKECHSRIDHFMVAQEKKQKNSVRN